MAGKKSRRGQGGGGEHENAERWLLTYADMITLLVAFFIMLYAMSVMNQAKFQQLAISVRSGFGTSVTGGVPTIFARGGGVNGTPTIISSSKTEPSSGDQFLKDVKARQDSDGLDKAYAAVVAYIQKNELQNAMHADRNERGVVVTVMTDKMLFARGAADLQPGELGLLDYGRGHHAEGGAGEPHPRRRPHGQPADPYGALPLQLGTVGDAGDHRAALFSRGAASPPIAWKRPATPTSVPSPPTTRKPSVPGTAAWRSSSCAATDFPCFLQTGNNAGNFNPACREVYQPFPPIMRVRPARSRAINFDGKGYRGMAEKKAEIETEDAGGGQKAAADDDYHGRVRVVVSGRGVFHGPEGLCEEQGGVSRRKWRKGRC